MGSRVEVALERGVGEEQKVFAGLHSAAEELVLRWILVLGMWVKFAVPEIGLVGSHSGVGVPELLESLALVIWGLSVE
jgi:hypothetical protein